MRRAVEQHPLALLDWSTLDPDDVREVSLGYKVTPKGGGAVDIHNKAEKKKQRAPPVGQLFHSDAHRWYFYPRVTPSEGLIFVQCDSRHPRQCFHTAFWDDSGGSGEPRRQSIELHAICAFPKKGGPLASRL